MIERLCRTYVRYQLEANKYETLYAESGKDAWKLYSEQTRANAQKIRSAFILAGLLTEFLDFIENLDIDFVDLV